jgi:hypothetical protein
VFGRIWQIKAFQRHCSYLKLLQTLVSTAIIVLESRRDPLPFFWRFYRVLKWGLFFYDRRNLTSTGHYPSTGGTHVGAHSSSGPLFHSHRLDPDRIENTMFCIFPTVSVEMETCLQCRWIAITDSTRSAIQSFSRHVFSMRFDAKNDCAGEDQQQFNWLTDLQTDRLSWLAYSKETNPSCHQRSC